MLRSSTNLKYNFINETRIKSKTHLRMLFFSDECRATLERPDGFWLRHEQSTPIRFKRQQGGGRILFWTANYKKHLIRLFLVDNGVKMD